MKKILVCMAVGVLTAGCFSSNKQNKDELSGQYTRYQIVDQEFDNLVVPNDEYDRVAPYEEQINETAYIQSSSQAKKSNKKPGRSFPVQKTVVDGNGNPLPADAAAPVTDEEALPDEPAPVEAAN